MPIKQSTLETSTKFLELMMSMMKIINHLNKKANDKDEKICLSFIRDLDGFKEEDKQSLMKQLGFIIENDEIITLHRKRAKMPLLTRNKKFKKVTCPYCDVEVTSNHLHEHQQTNKCLYGFITKTLSRNNLEIEEKSKIVYFDKRFILQNALENFKSNKNNLNYNKKIIEEPFESDDDDVSVSLSDDDELVTDALNEFSIMLKHQEIDNMDLDLD